MESFQRKQSENEYQGLVWFIQVHDSPRAPEARLNSSELEETVAMGKVHLWVKVTALPWQPPSASLEARLCPSHLPSFFVRFEEPVPWLLPSSLGLEMVALPDRLNMTTKGLPTSSPNLGLLGNAFGPTDGHRKGVA